MELNRDQLIDCVRRCNLNNIEESCKYCTNCYLSDWDLGGFNCHDDLANEVISRLEADEQKIKELTEQSQKWQEGYDCVDAACRELSSKCDELIEDTVHKMQTMIKEECIAGGIWPAFVARVVENVGKKLLEDAE